MGRHAVRFRSQRRAQCHEPIASRHHDTALVRRRADHRRRRWTDPADEDTLKS
jgi:hypothetical protein